MRAIPWFWRRRPRLGRFCARHRRRGARLGYDRFRAWRRNELFIRDPAQAAARRRRNRAASAWIIGPAVALAVAVTAFPGLLRIVLFAIGAGYLVPLSVFLVVHFALHHEEIERIARAMGDR